jgi:hypothetical protein
VVDGRDFSDVAGGLKGAFDAAMGVIFFLFAAVILLGIAVIGLLGWIIFF